MAYRSHSDGSHYRIRGRSAIYPSAGIRHEGALLRHGYNEEEGERSRHEALERAVRQDGYAKTEQRVNALAVINKGHASRHTELESDLRWLHERYRG